MIPYSGDRPATEMGPPERQQGDLRHRRAAAADGLLPATAYADHQTRASAVVTVPHVVITPDIVGRVAQIIDRHAADLRITHHWEEAAAYRILADPEIRAGLKAVEVLERLRTQHRPARWAGDSQTVVCRACQQAFPCTVAETIGTDR